MRKKFSVLPKTRWSAKSFWSVEPFPITVLIFSQAVLGIGDGLLVLADLGSAPWTVLSQGFSLQSGLSIGWTSFIISCAVMLFWLPLRLRLGLGTLLNIIVIALFLGLTVKFMPKPTALFPRVVYMSLGILLFSVGSAFYLTCHQGAGPRDGLMVGLCQRLRLNVGVVRTSLEVTVCTLGFLLGGTVGLGTVLFAISIGWIMQLTLTLIVNSPLVINKSKNLP